MLGASPYISAALFSLLFTPVTSALIGCGHVTDPHQSPIGEMVHWDQATVHIMSHGFTRGSAVFEVISFHQTPDGTAVFRLDEHLKRLHRTTEALSMDLFQSAQEIEHGIMETIKGNNWGMASSKSSVTMETLPSLSCHSRKSLICPFSQ